MVIDSPVSVCNTIWVSLAMSIFCGCVDIGTMIVLLLLLLSLLLMLLLLLFVVILLASGGG